MAKKQKLELRDVLALYQAFGPQVQQERQQQQQSAELQQLAAMLGIAGGAQTLQDAPAEAALRRRAGEANINATEASTRIAGERAPVEVENLRAQIQQAQQSGQLSAENLAQLKALFPLQQRTAAAQATGAEFQAADMPKKVQREEAGIKSDEAYRGRMAGAAESQAAASMLPQMQAFLQTVTGMKGPGGVDMTPEIQGQVLAHIMKNPELAAAFGKAGVGRAEITSAAGAAVGTKAPYKINPQIPLLERLAPVRTKVHDLMALGIPGSIDWIREQMKPKQP